MGRRGDPGDGGSGVGLILFFSWGENDLEHPVEHAVVEGGFGRERTIVDEAWPGDILGLINPGQFRIGDVLSSAGPVTFHAVPRFSPEQFASVRLADPGARKGFLKGLQQIAEEGVVQVFWPKGGAPLPILGAVGRLQFEVLQHRLKDEYACQVVLEPRSFQMARWLQGGWPEANKFWGELVEDADGNPAILFENDWPRPTSSGGSWWKMPTATRPSCSKTTGSAVPRRKRTRI